MAKQNIQSNFTFTFEDDIDDETFLRGINKGTPGFERIEKLNRERQMLIEKQKRLEENCVLATQRSLSLLKESEDVGVATAMELARQRSQLERTEQHLDEINTALRFSQRHLQGMKSLLGGVKNYFSGKSGEQPPSVSSVPASHVEDAKSYTQKPQSLHGSSTSSDPHPDLEPKGRAPTFTGSKEVQAVLERNLNEIGSSVNFLKGLAEGLSSELESQTQLIERVVDKTEKTDFKIAQQNRDMNKLMKK